MKIALTFPLALTYLISGSGAFAGEFGSSCAQMDPNNRYVERSNSLMQCILEGFGAHYTVADLVDLDAACKKEGMGRYTTVASDLAIVAGKPPKAELFIFCWPGQFNDQ